MSEGQYPDLARVKTLCTPNTTTEFLNFTLRFRMAHTSGTTCS